MCLKLEEVDVYTYQGIIAEILFLYIVSIEFV